MERLFRFLENNKLLINVIILSIIIISVISMFQIKQDLIPQASPDVISATIFYPGAAAKDVEQNAIIPIENKLKNIIGIKEYNSISLENSGRVVIYIDQNADNVKSVKDEIFRELNNIPYLTEEVEGVIVKDLNPKLRPVYEIGIYPKKGSNITKKELYDFIDGLEDELLDIKEVGDITKEGYSDREIKIKVNPERIDNYYISLNEIIDSIKIRNVRSLGGSLQSVHRDKNIVTIGEFEDPLDVGEVIIRSDFEGNRVIINDIAKIEDDYKRKNVEIKINGNDGVTLKIIKKADADIVKTVKKIKKYLNSIRYVIPENIEISRISDASLSIVSLLKVLKSNALIGFIFVFIILFIFLQDFRTSFWIAFGIPFVIMITIIILNQIGFSLNLISLLALITLMGMLVDDGIVISEIIYEYKSKGMPPIEAAIKGTKDVIAPVAVSSITTIVAFLPMLSMGGMMGKFIFVFPIIVAITLLASLLEAGTFLPIHLAHSKIRKNKKANWFDPIAKAYERILSILLKWRYLILLIFIILFIFTIKIVQKPVKNFVLLDDDSSDKILIKLEAETGINLSTTSNYTKKIEKIITNKIKPEELISTKTSVGHHITNGMKNKGYHENWALIEVNLVPLTERERNADEIIDKLRNNINTKSIHEFKKIIMQKEVFGPPMGDPVDIKLISKDEGKVLTLMKGIEDYLKTIDGVIDIDNDQKRNKDEIKIDFDYKKMAKLGINVSTVANIVRTAYEGVIATTIIKSNEELDFRVQIDDSFQTNEVFLQNLLIPNIKGNLVKLKDIASFINDKSSASINHYNGNKVITVTANIDQTITTSRKVTKEVRKMYKGNIPGVKILFGGESSETKDTIKDLAFSFLLSIILIYFILIVLFKSISQPLLIMMTIPFAIAGALIGLVLSGFPLSLMAAIGIIGLCGVVVNDNIVMIDFINKIFKENKGKRKIISLIAEGAKKRLRPVILTTVTTIAALIPTIYGIGGYAGRITPVAIIMAYGLAFDTLVTLIYLPCLYLIRIDIKQIPHFFKGILKGK